MMMHTAEQTLVFAYALCNDLRAHDKTTLTSHSHLCTHPHTLKDYILFALMWRVNPCACEVHNTKKPQLSIGKCLRAHSQNGAKSTTE